MTTNTGNDDTDAEAGTASAREQARNRTLNRTGRRFLAVGGFVALATAVYLGVVASGLLHVSPVRTAVIAVTGLVTVAVAVAAAAGQRTRLRDSATERGT